MAIRHQIPGPNVSQGRRVTAAPQAEGRLVIGQ